MNVRQLIDALSALDPDLPVIMPRWSSDNYCEVGSAFVDTVLPDPEGGHGLQLADERDKKPLIKVVRLFEPDE
jgi:hypothetical protein